MNMWVWLIVLVVMLILEVATTSALVSIWFAFGAIAALILNLLQVGIVWEFVAFFVISLLSLFFIRPLAASYMRGNIIATNSDRVIGQIGKLTKAITNESWGEIKLLGNEWHCVEVNNKELDANTLVEVLAIEGSKLIVRECTKGESL